MNPNNGKSGRDGISEEYEPLQERPRLLLSADLALPRHLEDNSVLETFH
jgi:hypothetical protein